MILTETYTNFLIENKINPEQFLLLLLMYERRIDLIRDYKKTFNKVNNLLSKEELQDLVDKGFINILNPSSTNISYSLTTKFISIFVTPDIVVEEIYNLYPDFLKTSDGINIPLTAMNREEFKDSYMKKIHYSIQEHKEILKDIEYAISNNFITLGIANFLASEQWKAFRKKRNKDTNFNKPDEYERNF